MTASPEDDGLRGAVGGRTRLHGHRGDRVAVDDRRTGTHELGERHAGHRLCVELGQRAGRGHRCVRALHDERRDEQGLAVPRVDLHRAQHGRVPHQRGVAVDEREQDRALAGVRPAEHDAGHLHAVHRALGRVHRTHERLVGIAHVGAKDLQVALGDRHVLGLADDSAGVIQGRQPADELDEVLEVFERPPATGAVEVTHVGRAVDRREDEVRTADHDAPGRVARMLRESVGGQRELGHRQLTRDAYPLALDFRPRGAPQRECFGVATEVDADLLENAHRGLVDRLLAIGGEECVDGDAVDRLDDGLDAAPRPRRRGLPDTAATPADARSRGRITSIHGRR